MDPVLTSWAFGFGGWIGVFGSTFLFLNVPHNHTLLLLLLSPWLGGISLYLLMFATHAWINVAVQVARAMTKYEIIMAVLTSCIGVLIVGIARLIIDLERGHRTPAQAAAEESAAAATATPADDSSETETSHTASSETEAQIEPETDNESESGSQSESEDEESKAEDESETEDESEDESNNEQNDGNDGDDEDSNETGSDALNEGVIEDSSSSSYENINTPQLSAIPKLPESPVPKIPDI